MCLTDTDNVESSAIYALSELDGIEWFKNVVLIGGDQDSYCSLESARMQRSGRVETDTQVGTQLG